MYIAGDNEASDRGGSFDSPSMVPGTTDEPPGFNGSIQGMLMRKLALNEQGQIGVVNSNFRPGDRSRVRLIEGAGLP